MTAQIQKLANRINDFDFYYDYSEDHRRWDKWNREEKSIKAELDTLKEDSLLEIKALITKEEKHIIFKFGAYFENLQFQQVKEARTSQKENLSRIMRTAWDYIRKGLYTSISQALKASWARFKLISQLRSGVAYFTFTKATGEIRNAIGTLRDGNFSYNYKGSKRDKPELINYFDLELRGWRSCRVDRLLTVKA